MFRFLLCVYVFLVEAFITSNKFDIIRMSDSFLDATIANDDVNIKQTGTIIIR